MKVVALYFMNNKLGKMKYVSLMENSVMRKQVVRVLYTVNKPIVTPFEGNCVMDVKQLLMHLASVTYFVKN